mmetsp:Transcript_1943/g.4890  ORF Transcript_1943/g.4890 Transcript_1943/m.4890 type:complete len:238 (+) Transcript_1943:105-818(+)
MAARTDSAYVWSDKVDRENRGKRLWYATYGQELGLGSRPVTEPSRPPSPRMTSGMKWVDRRQRRYPFQIEDQLQKTLDRMESQIERKEEAKLSPHCSTYFGPTLHGSMPLSWVELSAQRGTPTPSVKSASVRSGASALSGVSKASKMSGASLPSLKSVSISSGSQGERRQELLLQRQAQLEQQLKQVEAMLTSQSPSTDVPLQLSDFAPPKSAASPLPPLPEAPIKPLLPVGYLLED